MPLSAWCWGLLKLFITLFITYLFITYLHWQRLKIMRFKCCLFCCPPFHFHIDKHQNGILAIGCRRCFLSLKNLKPNIKSKPQSAFEKKRTFPSDTTLKGYAAVRIIESRGDEHHWCWLSLCFEMLICPGLFECVLSCVALKLGWSSDKRFFFLFGCTVSTRITPYNVNKRNALRSPVKGNKPQLTEESLWLRRWTGTKLRMGRKQISPHFFDH